MEKIGLKIGQKTYFEDDDAKPDGGMTAPSPSPAIKRVRTGSGSGSGLQAPRCQVEGCNLDLSDAKTYYSRHKVCGAHSKTAKVVVNGLEQRFCQQCSRFHQLPEFDQGKRSCRRRLAGHNERRRKPTSGTLLSNRYGNLPNSIFGTGINSGGFLMDFSSGSRARIVNWPSPRAPAVPEKFPPLPWQSHLDNPPPYVPPGGCFNGVQESNCALSLLSNHTSSSTNQPLTHEYYVNTNPGPCPGPCTGPGQCPGHGPGQHMIQPQPQPPTGTIVHGHVHGHGHGHYPGWGFDTNDAHLGLGQVTEPTGYPGELGLGQQVGRRYESSGDHIDWSL